MESWAWRNYIASGSGGKVAIAGAEEKNQEKFGILKESA
jgi:hypothetical protein